MNQRTLLAGHKVSEADGGQGDDHEVDGLQCAPALNVLEDDGRQSHEDHTAEQDEEYGGEDPDLHLAHVPLLEGRRGRGKC